MKIPATIAAGDSATWKDAPTVDNARRALSPPSWTLKYAIRGAQTLDLTATQDGTDWTTSISKAQSAALTAGRYYWQAYVENGSERITIGNGQLDITPNLSTASAGAELRTQSKQDLDAVQAAMRAMIAGGAVQKYMIHGRQVEKMTMADLIQLESKLKATVARENAAQSIANGQGNPNNVFVRFS